MKEILELPGTNFQGLLSHIREIDRAAEKASEGRGWCRKELRFEEQFGFDAAWVSATRSFIILKKEEKEFKLKRNSYYHENLDFISAWSILSSEE